MLTAELAALSVRKRLLSLQQLLLLYLLCQVLSDLALSACTNIAHIRDMMLSLVNDIGCIITATNAKGKAITEYRVSVNVVPHSRIIRDVFVGLPI